MGILGRYFGKKDDDGAAPEKVTAQPAGPDYGAFVRSYHQATKHHPGNYARGPHGLDWDTQPDPFRRYAGSEVLSLSLSEPPADPRFDEIVREGAVAAAAVNRDSISALLRYALGLSAWKQYGDNRWALRMNPSSGNLHPTEGYLLAGPDAGLSADAIVAHYAPKAHALEVRARLAPEHWQRLMQHLPEDALLVGLTSVLWREEWKYGERAYRYCQHDVGHAIAAVAYSANCLGWSVRMLDHVSSEEIADVLGLHGFGEAEPEEADCLLAIFPGEAPSEVIHLDEIQLDGQALAEFGDLTWQGAANQLSPDHLEWDAIYACALAALKPATTPVVRERAPDVATNTTPPRPASATQIIAQRRSAVSMDGRTSMSSAAFFLALERCMPRADRVPYASLPWKPRTHLLMFVHRVEDLERGAYALLREPESGARLRAAMSEQFDWQPVPGAPADLPLFHLKDGDLRFMAASISCDQSIAGEGAFSFGMVVDFERAIGEHGPWFYPRLFWETGLVGQTFYLEAEAAGLRSTGIGCFFDDAMHRSFGLHGFDFQSLYHFTLGAPVEDTRLQSLPPYDDRALRDDLISEGEQLSD